MVLMGSVLIPHNHNVCTNWGAPVFASIGHNMLKFQFHSIISSSPKLHQIYSLYVPEVEKTQAELEYEAELQKSEELRKIYLEQKESIRQLRVGILFCESTGG